LKIDEFHLGIEHVGGSMFECIPQGDAIMLKVGIYSFRSKLYVILAKYVDKYQ